MNCRSFWCAVSVILISATHAAGATDQALNRWAIVASKPVQASGLADLLLVELSRQEGIELVERDALDAATKELELASVLGSKAASQRLKLGRILKADALVVLSIVEREKSRFVKLVIADCRYGARLRTDYLPDAPEGSDRTARQMASAVQATRKHFRGGIRHIVGVSPFVSKNLEHDYDHLQSSYAHLLQNALTAYQGVAAIETEEAAAIGRELALSDRPGIRRVVPILLDVDFTVRRAGDDQEPQIALTIRTSSGSGGRKPTIETQRMPLSRAVSFVTEQLPLRYLRISQEALVRRISSPEQICWLVDRADVFSQLGDWQHAAGLREAALLLDPHRVPQRMKLILEYRRAYSDALLKRQTFREGMRLHGAPPIDDPSRLPQFHARVAAYLAALPHLEYLVRHRRIDWGLTLGFAKGLTTRRLTIGLPVHRLSSRLKQQVLSQLAAAERAEMRILAEVIPLALKLPQKLPAEVAAELAGEKWHESNYDIMNLESYLGRMAELAIEVAVYRCDRDYYTAEDLADVKYVLWQVIGKHGLSPSQTRSDYIFRRPRRSREDTRPADEVTPEEWIAFLRELTDSPYAASKMHGFYGLLESLDRNTPAGQTARLAVAREAIAWMDKFDNGTLPDPQPKSLGAGTGRFLRRLCEDCLQAKGGVVRRNPAQVKAEMARRRAENAAKRYRPTYVSVKPVSPGSPDSPLIADRLRIEPIDMKVRKIDGQSGLSWGESLGLRLLGLTPCGDALDVAWSEHAILLMRTPNLLEEVLVDPDEQFVDAKWDGRSIWVAGLNGGIVVLDRAGDLIGRVGRKQGLPPCDRKLLLLPIRTGQCIAAGQFGPQGRAWCALITREESGPTFRVRVFHEAAKAPLKGKYNTPDDPQLAFEPTALHVCDAPLDGRRLLYVHREAPSAEAQGGNPLAVDLSTLEVSIARLKIQYGHRAITIQRRPASVGRPTRKAWEFHIPHWEVMDRDWPDGKPAMCCGETCVPRVLYHDGWFYSVGGCWLRTNARTWEYEYLLDGFLPKKYSYLEYAVSAHYGLVGWGPRRFYRIIVEDGTQNENQSGRQGQPAGAEKKR